MKRFLLAFLLIPLNAHCSEQYNTLVRNFFIDISSDSTHWTRFIDTTITLIPSHSTFNILSESAFTDRIQHNDSTDLLWINYLFTVSDSIEIANQIKGLRKFTYKPGVVPGFAVAPPARIRRIRRLFAHRRWNKAEKYTKGSKGVIKLSPPIFYNNGKKAIVQMDCHYYYVNAGYGAYAIFEWVNGKWKWKHKINFWVS